MVAPEQCATAPKTLVSKQAAAPAAAKTSTTRVVLLAVLALAAATGAMFGVVVFGNEFTKDMHPKGGALVDSEDRAVATAAVESYVSLLDLPLLGTAELNKVDGITFSTYKGIEHRKVTGYTVTKETAVVGDSEVATPRLSLATSAPGVTVEVSVRDNKAWLSDAAAGKVATTAIDATSQRRLADGGSCLENGACLYSRDELLHLDAASRRLEEGSFFARADVAAYQVELDGDVMPYLERSAEGSAYLDGTWVEGGHRLRLRVAETPAGTEAFFTNYSSGKSKLLTKDGAYMYSYDGRLRECQEAYHGAVADYTVDSLVNSMTFESVEVSHGEAQADFIPFHPAAEDCFALVSKLGNMSTPEALEAFPKLAGAMQNADVVSAAKGSIYSAKNRRRLAKTVQMQAKRDRHPSAQEMLSLMAKEPRRKLGVSNYDLWVATRMADPTFIDFGGYVSGSWADAAFSGATGKMPTDVALSLGGLYGISKKFAEWSGFTYYGARRRLSEETEQRKLRGMPMDMCGELEMMCFKFRDERACMEFEMTCGKSMGKAMKPMKLMAADDLYFAKPPEDLAVDSYEYKMAKEKAIAQEEMVMHFYQTDVATEYLAVPSKESIQELDIGSISCGSYTSMDTCLGYEFAGCAWNDFYSCCSDAGIKCGGAELVELDLAAALGGVGDKASTYTTAITKTTSFLTAEFAGSCPGGFLPTNPMMDAIKIGLICKEVKSGDFAGMCAGTDSSTFSMMTEPNAWASLLVKDGKKVASFQGTKMHDASMMDYSLKRDPVYLKFGGPATVIQEGYALYVSHLFTCMYAMPSPDFVTGHSLGGAAAVVYNKIVGGSLVTFGAPATYYRSFGVSGLTSPSVTTGYEIKTKLPVSVPSTLPTYSCGGSSVRYFHKFDPIPGFYYAGGMWMHETAKAVMVWDEASSACGVSGSCGVNPKVNGAIKGTTLPKYLCTEFGIKTSAKSFGCSGMDYFSYTNVINPVPCAEVILAQAYAMYPAGSGDVLEVIPWMPSESFAGCMESYIGSISAYFALYITSDLEELRPIAGRDALEIGIFYAAWGLMWIHSSYANYCLTGSSYGSSLAPARGNKVAAFKSLGQNVYPSYESGLNEAILNQMIATAEGMLPSS